MPRFDFIVFAHGKDGADDAFDDGYTHRHLRDAMRIPGVVGSQRFVRGEHQRDPGPFAWKYPGFVIARAKALTGRAPQVGLQEGMRRIIARLDRKNRNA